MVELQFLLSKTGLDAIKTEIRTEGKSVKSSHRCEAIARGFGRSTYATLLAELNEFCQAEVSLDEGAFKGYLDEHGFNMEASPLYRASARAALSNVLSEYPELTADGMGVYARHSWGYESTPDFELRQKKSRAKMQTAKAAECFLLALAFVQRIPATKTIRHGVGYRRLKHIAENMAATYPNGAAYGPQYLPAGFVLAAAIHSGFKWKKIRGLDGNIGPEVRFNVSSTEVDDLDCQIRPDGSLAKSKERERQLSERRQAYPQGTFTS